MSASSTYYHLRQSSYVPVDGRSEKREGHHCFDTICSVLKQSFPAKPQWPHAFPGDDCACLAGRQPSEATLLQFGQLRILDSFHSSSLECPVVLKLILATMFNMPASSRQHRPFQGWKWMTIGLMTLYCVATCVNATVVCSDCRPLDLQEAPGTRREQ